MDKDKTGQDFPVGSIVELFDTEGMGSSYYKKGETFRVVRSSSFSLSGKRYIADVIRVSDGRSDTFYSYRFRLSNPYTDGDWV